MGIVIRQSVKSTAVTLIGAVLGAVLIALSARLMPAQELGFSRILTSYAVISASILVLGFHATLAVFIYRYPLGDPRRAPFIGLCLAVPMGAVTVLSGMYAAFRSAFVSQFQPADIPFFNQYFIWLPIFTLFAALQVIFEAYLMSHLKIAQYTFVREVGLKGGNLALILLFGTGVLSFSEFIVFSVLLYAGACAVLGWMIYRTGGFSLSFNWKLLSRAEVRELLHFAGFHALLGVSLNLLNALDGIMLAPLNNQGLKASAVYSVAAFAISILLIPMRALTHATTPVLTQAYQAGDTAKVASLFRKSSDTMFLASLGIGVVILANLRNGVVLLGPGFQAIVYIVPILVLGRLVDAATGMNDQVLSISRHYRFSFLLSIGLVVAVIGLNRLLIPRYGMLGAASGTTLAILAYNLGKWYFVKRKLDLHPFSAITLRILAAGGLTLGAALLVLPFRPIPANTLTRTELVAVGGDALVRTTLIAILYPALLLLFKAVPDLLPLFRNLRNRVQKRHRR